MKRFLTLIRLTSKGMAYSLLALVFLWAVLATPNLIKYYSASVTLPNGMILKRQFNFTRIGRDDLFAADGHTRLVRDIEFVCFDDRYVEVYAYSLEYSGVYDARTNGPVWNGDFDAYRGVRRASGLIGGRGCNGYYTAVYGPSLLYDGNKWPFLPSCDDRNLENKSLADRSWFERPCDHRPSR